MSAFSLAGPDQACALARVHAAAFAKSWSADSIAKMLEVPGTFALLEASGAGMIIIRVGGDQADLVTLAVLPESRRQGIALALLAQAKVWSAGMGAKSLFLEVAEDNGAAINLYVKQGFLEISRRKAYYDGKMDAIVMASALTFTLPPLG